MDYRGGSEKIFNTIQNIVKNNKDTPYLIAEITSVYLGNKEIIYGKNSKTNTILKQIKLTCTKYDETIKYEGDKRTIEEIKKGYSNLICGLAEENTLEDLLNKLEDILEQSNDKDFSKTG